MLIPINHLVKNPVLSKLTYDKAEYSISELLDLAKGDKNILYYLKDQYMFTEADKDLYNIFLQIANSDNILYSNQVTDSKYIYHSENVVNSNNIHNSTEVDNSNIVIGSDVVSNSSQVFLSSFIDNCQKVESSLTVNDSINIIHSRFIIKSKNIYESNNIIDSNIIFRGLNLEDCYFCNDAKNLKHCICCCGISNEEYLIFNKKVDEKLFEVIKKQFLTIMDCLLKYTYGWPVDFLIAETPVIDRNFVRHYETIPPKFWKWVKTLPNYSDEFMFYLTSLPEFLTK